MHSKPKRFVVGLCCIALTLVGATHVVWSQTTSSNRAMTPEDLLTRQALRETVLSPDGKWAAIVVERSRKVGESYERGYLRGLERSDIWLASTDGRKAFNVTRGEAFHAGFWNPVWSPDSKRLAMASTRGGDNVRAYVYDLNTHYLRACITGGLDLGLRIEPADSEPSTMAWLAPNQLLLGVLPPGVRPIPLDETERTARIAANAIAAVKRGRGVTASILDTEALESPPIQQVALSVVDVVTSKARVLLRLPLIEVRLTQRIVSISPNRSYAAILATDHPKRVPPERRLTTDDLSPLRLGVAALVKANETPLWVENVQPAKFGLGGTPTTIRWAPRGATFALIGMSNQDVLPHVFTVRADEKQPRAVSALQYDENARDAELLTAEDIQWTSNGELLVYGYAGTGASLRAEVSRKDTRGFARDNSGDSARRDWWIISSHNSYHNLTRDLALAPRVLFQMRNSHVLVAAGGGRILTVDAASRTVKALNEKGTAPASLVWPRPVNTHRPADDLIVSYARDNGTDFFRFDVSGGAPLKLGTIPRGSVFTGYSASHQSIMYETDINEVRVIARSIGQPSTLISVNRHLDAIAKPQYRTFQYQTVAGQTLSGSLLLPYGYSPGQRYPVIVYVYGGSVAPAGDWANPYSIRSSGLIDPLILAGRGYAVLIPSVPLEPMGQSSDPMLDLDKGVKPAIEKVVELGIADPDRIGLMGHSYGGYTAYGLVTQTQRFKAAVAYAGVTDLLSLYGSLDPRYRFNDVLNPNWGPYWLESQQMRMGVPPWKDLDRYLRNSPYLHVDKVTTPLLMIHGDLDSIPLSQAEQFFVALNRMGKRAKLVRYLAEGHVVESPGNTLDMWEHILNWFDEFLQNRQPNQSAKTK
jgi:dipeptidyl aminopeptidase/acylaminoacyl peptidase